MVILDNMIRAGRVTEFVREVLKIRNEEMVDKARANHIITNVFESDEPEETVEFLNMGIDVILTNDYNRIAQAVADWKKK